ncbi:MAG: hypothetical protein IPG32_21530 [Saprospirales bacterium]|nr:hypothetical protein [Saprospirales bacterium]
MRFTALSTIPKPQMQAHATAHLSGGDSHADQGQDNDGNRIGASPV